jgi:hypothetical protein
MQPPQKSRTWNYEEILLPAQFVLGNLIDNEFCKIAG